MDNRAIGVFDSGLGGLTAVRTLRKLVPNERIVFLGDTARMPYGSRDTETLRKFAEDDFRFLMTKDVKYILIACGTVSSNIENVMTETLSVPVTGVIEPTAEAAIKTSDNGNIGVIATEACIRSGAFQRRLTDLCPSVTVTAVPCPKLVPLIESISPEEYSHALTDALDEYLKPIKENHCDTLILGCTHYPLISDLISENLGYCVNLIDSGAEAARYTVSQLTEFGLLSPSEKNGAADLYVTASPDRFTSSAAFFLGYTPKKATLVDLQIYE